jgi:uncharacterized protein (TIGR03435 family)
MTRVWFLTILAGALLSAHSPPPAQSAAFEVASVKENNSGDERFGWGPRGGTFQTRNLSLRWIIAQAYGIGLGTDTTRLDQFVLLGGPAAILDARFDIVGTLPGGAATPEQIRSMLRALLAERFKLRVHTEARQMPVYELRTRASGTFGPNFRKSTHDCPAFIAAGGTRQDADNPRDTNNRLLCWQELQSAAVASVNYAGPIAELVRGIQASLDRPVIDGTGLTGNYEWYLRFDRELRLDAAPATRPGSAPPSIFTAISEQLGLTLEPTRGPVDVWVIDSVEMPTPD